MHPMLKLEVAQRLATLFSENNPQSAEDACARLTRLRELYRNCQRCPLAHQGRTQVVFGEGSPSARVLFVGEAPGRDEDLQGRPFVGRSGQLLTAMLNELGLTREYIYISNTARCRPPANRQPTPQETSICISHLLLREISIIRPQLICTLGATATNAFLEDTKSLSSIRGQIIQTEYFSIMPTYHPAYLLRNRSATPTVKNDFLNLIAFLSEKTK